MSYEDTKDEDNVVLNAVDDELERTGINNIDHGMAHPPLLSELKADFTAAEVDHISCMDKIYKWRQARANKTRTKSRKGRSQYQSKLIRVHNEWTYSGLAEPFLAGPNLFHITGKDPENESRGVQNNILVNAQINTKLKKRRIIDKLTHILVDDGTVVLRSSWNKEQRVVEREEPTYDFVPLTEKDDPNLVQTIVEGIRNPQLLESEDVPIELKLAVSYTNRTGELHQAIQSGTKIVQDVEITKNAPDISVFNYDNFYPDPNCHGDMSEAQFAVLKTLVSTSDMRKQPERYFNVDKITKTSTSQTSVTTTNDPTDTSRESVIVHDFKDKARRLHEMYEYWGFYDYTGTGVATAFIMSWIGDVVVRLEKMPLTEVGIPFELIQYMPDFSSNIGEPDAELISGEQATIGALTRGVIDVFAKSANGQKAVRANTLSPINEKRFLNNQDFKFQSTLQDPRSLFHVFQYPDVPSSVFNFMNHQQRSAEYLSGTQPFGAEGMAKSQSVSGMQNVLDSSTKRKSAILRRIGEGLETMCRHIIAMNAEYLTEVEIVKITDNEYVEIDPEDLRGNFDVTIKVSTPEKDEAQVQKLTMLMQTNGPSTDPRLTQLVQSEIMELMGNHNLAEVVREYVPKPDPVAERIAELNQKLLEAQIENELGKAYENQSNGDFDQARVHTEAAKAMKLKAEAEALDLDFVEKSTGVHQARSVQLAQLNHAGKQTSK